MHSLTLACQKYFMACNKKNIPDILTPNGFLSRSVGRRPLRQFTFASRVATVSDRYSIRSSPVMVLPGAHARPIGVEHHQSFSADPA